MSETIAESILITSFSLMFSLNERDRGIKKEIELSNGCITVIPRFNGCLVWNKAVLSPIEIVLCWRDEVRPPHKSSPRWDWGSERRNKRTVRKTEWCSQIQLRIFLLWLCVCLHVCVCVCVCVMGVSTWWSLVGAGLRSCFRCVIQSP